METKDPPIEQKRRRSDQDRLESWKAIANYLHRSVRTARRWEAQESLPVHRQQFAKGNSVFAYCSELDEWRNSHHQPQQIERMPISESVKAAVIAHRKGYLVIAVIAALSGGFIGKLLWHSELTVQLPQTSANAWVLIAEPINHQIPKVYGDKFKATLQREFSGSGKYLVLPAARVQDTLKLMRQDTQAELIPVIARELAQRDGRVKALLISRIEQFGGSQVFSIEAINPKNNRLIAYASEEAKSLDSVSTVFEQLARDIHAKLKSSSGNLQAEYLDPVTTASMPALRLYSQALQLLIADQADMAQVVLGHAIEADETFVSARVLQAWALRMSGAEKDIYMPIMNSVIQSDWPISDPERYLLEGSYSHFLGDLIYADANYKALLENQPGHIFGAKVRLELCLESNPSSACVPQKVYLAKLRPRDFEINMQTAWTLAQDPARTKLASRFAEKSLGILQQDYNNFAPGSVAQAMFFPIATAWTEGDLQAALQRGRHVRDELPLLTLETRHLTVKHLVEFSLVLGQIKEAKNLLEQVQDPGLRYELHAKILFAEGDMSGLKNHLASGKYSRQQMIALFMSISGFNDEAMALFEELPKEANSVAQQAVILANAALGNKDFDTAKRLLRVAVEGLTPEDHVYYFMAVDMLSKIYKIEGNLVEAVSVLESTMPQRNKAIYNGAGMFWLKCQDNLAHLYRDVGRERDAVLVEKELRKLFSLADENFSLNHS